MLEYVLVSYYSDFPQLRQKLGTLDTRVIRSIGAINISIIKYSRFDIVPPVVATIGTSLPVILVGDDVRYLLVRSEKAL